MNKRLFYSEPDEEAYVIGEDGNVVNNFPPLKRSRNVYGGDESNVINMDCDTSFEERSNNVNIRTAVRIPSSLLREFSRFLRIKYFEIKEENPEISRSDIINQIIQLWAIEENNYK